MTDTIDRRPFWISWWDTRDLGGFELHTPWWISGERMDDAGSISVCAAVMATSEAGAQEEILAAYDTTPDAMEWRFTSEQAPGWSPFGGRWPRAEWMQWPDDTPEDKR